MRLPDLARLHRRRERDAAGLFLVEGVRSVEAAVEAGASIAELLVTPQSRLDPRVAAVLTLAVPVREVGPRELAKVSEVETAQGLVALARFPEAPPPLATAARVLALDGVQDPGNVGALLRVAAWFGLDAVVAGAGTADFFGAKVVRSAMGGLWDVALHRTDDLAATLDALGAAGFGRYGAALDGADVDAWRPAAPSVLVLGSEAHGLSPEVAARLDGTVTIPGSPRRRGAESLNVAVAAGVLVHAWVGSAGHGG